jgi:hypothetical protein
MRDWGFRLPTATAILTVLFPRQFTVYDMRVCESLGAFRKLENRRFSEELWKNYLSFKREIRNAAPSVLSLRDKDRYLWGKSFHKQVVKDCT